MNPKALLIAGALTGSVCLTVGLAIYFTTLKPIEHLPIVEPIATDIEAELEEPSVGETPPQPRIEPAPIEQPPIKSLKLVFAERIRDHAVEVGSTKQSADWALDFALAPEGKWKTASEDEMNAVALGLVGYFDRDLNAEQKIGAGVMYRIWLNEFDGNDLFGFIVSQNESVKDNRLTMINRLTSIAAKAVNENIARREGRVFRVVLLKQLVGRNEMEFHFKITNDSTKKVPSLTLELELLDELREHIGHGSAIVNQLGPSDTQFVMVSTNFIRAKFIEVSAKVLVGDDKEYVVDFENKSGTDLQTIIKNVERDWLRE